MKKFIAVLAFTGLLGVAHAGTPSVYVAKSPDGTMVVTITSKPCVSSKILKLVEPSWRSKMQAASVIYNSRELDACWAALSDGNVGIIDEDGDQGTISPSEFKPAEDI